MMRTRQTQPPGGAPPIYHAAWGEARPGLVARAFQAAAPAILLLLGALLPPDRPFPYDLCLWHRLTGLNCLGCGLSRSVCHLLHGDVARSLTLHPAGVLVVAIAVFMALRGTRELVRIGGEAARAHGLTRRG